MPFSVLGALLSVAMMVAGAMLHLATSHKRIAKVVMGSGVAVMLMTLGVIALMVNSQM